jgi:hypothetical protein
MNLARFAAWVALLLACWPEFAAGQTRRLRAVEVDEPELPQVADSGVGYIDTALIGNRLRLRYDAAYDNVKPSRAEFFWPVGMPLGPGPGPETSVDYQDISAYAEWSPRTGLSLFGESAFRFIDPELNDNTSGFGDLSAGFKLAWCEAPCRATTLQLRAYLPTGDGSRGLGTEHVSLEPAVLLYRQLTARVTLEAELRDWIALDGTDDFAGNVLRYGTGLSYRVTDGCRPISAVAELVGWTVLDGMTAFSPTPGTSIIEDAEGDTIVNAKLGMRWRISPVSDLYGGYGQAVTGETWYDRTVRLEFRRSF